MEEAGSVDVVLEFLQKNGFSRAAAALRCELSNGPDRNGFGKVSIDEKMSGRNSEPSSREVVVKEIECGSGSGNFRVSKEGKCKSAPAPSDGGVGPSDVGFGFSKGLDDTVLELYPWKRGKDNGVTENDVSLSPSPSPSLIEFQRGGSSCLLEVGDMGKVDEEIVFVEPKKSSRGDKARGNSQRDELKGSELQKRTDVQSNEDVANSSHSEWNDCAVKSVLSFSNSNPSDVTDSALSPSGKEPSTTTDMPDFRVATKGQVDEVGRSLYHAKLQGISDKKKLGDLGLMMGTESHKEEFPRLPPVKLKSEDKPVNARLTERHEQEGLGLKLSSADDTYLIGSYLDVPVGQEISSSGCRRMAGGNWLSVSRGIAEDTSDLVSGFATIGDGLSESIGYPNDYWDSDEYDDDDDVGYMRQPIEDEAWFLAHEIDYPSDNEKGTGQGSIPDARDRDEAKIEDDQSFAEEDSYFSGEQYMHSNSLKPVSATDDPGGLSITEVYDKTDDSHMIAQYDGQLMDEEELSLMRSEPVWQGFVTQSDDLIMMGDGIVMNECVRPIVDDGCIDDDQHGSVRSIGVGINSDVADIGSEVRDSLIGGSIEGDLEYFHDREVGFGSFKYLQNRATSDRKMIKANRYDSDKSLLENDKGTSMHLQNSSDVGFSFAPPVRDEPAGSGKATCSNDNKAFGDEHNESANTLSRSDYMLPMWRRKSGDSSPERSPLDENDAPIVRSAESTPSTLSDYTYAEKEHVKKADDKITSSVREEDDVGASMEDEEAAAVQEQVRQIKSQEEEFETFNLKVVHRKNRTGFEEDKNFHVVLNSVIAGRYHVTEYLGSAAFSKAIQAHDLHTGMDVCVKIIKNNKDFFDQSLDEIKLLKFINKHDPADKYHLLRLYDYFYYREHLLIVCELLKANLYEFHKFNRESGGEVYFTMPRLQSITIQVLEALRFLHDLGLIHCDLKPENILVKSYSRCEVKVIDLGSSCFETDHLCSYVQSRSYRAPEVILGLPYDKKIDIWSLGCILAELCTGNVCWEKFARYFEVELKEVKLREGYYVMDPEKAVEMVDENTICVAAILGSTLTGEFEDVKLLHDLLTEKNRETGWDTPIHVDAASGGFIAPFIYPDIVWDFRLPLVKSINVSGHKYGLVYAGVGWVVWRSKDDLPEDLIFHINYLGSDQPTFTLNFSKGSSHIIAQYYQLIRLGFEGYKHIMNNCRENATILKEGIEKTGKFEVVSKDVGVPLVAFSLKDSNKYTVFDIADNIRKYGWIVPAYTMPANAEHIAVLRVVIREDFNRSLAERLVADIQRVVTELETTHPVPVSVKSAHVTIATPDDDQNEGGMKKDVTETQRDITKYWKRVVDRIKTNGVC